MGFSSFYADFIFIFFSLRVACPTHDTGDDLCGEMWELLSEEANVVYLIPSLFSGEPRAFRIALHNAFLQHMGTSRWM